MWQRYEDYCCKGLGKCKVSRVCDSLWCTCRCPRSKGSIQDDRGALVWPWCCLQMCSSKFSVPNSYVKQLHVPWASWNKAPAQVANPEARKTWCWDSPTNYTKGSLMVYSWMPVHVCNKSKTIKMPLKRDLYPGFEHRNVVHSITQNDVFWFALARDSKAAMKALLPTTKTAAAPPKAVKLLRDGNDSVRAVLLLLLLLRQKIRFNATAVATATTIPPSTPPSTTKDNDNNGKHDDFEINDYIIDNKIMMTMTIIIPIIMITYIISMVMVMITKIATWWWS